MSVPPPPEDFLRELRLPLDRLPTRLRIPTPGHAGISCDIRPPGSKSLTNRALLLAALAEGESRLERPLIEADDARVMIGAIRALGAEVTQEPAALRVRGVGGCWRVPRDGVTLNLQNAGTAVRFLAASVLCSPAPLTIDGNARMRERPVRELAECLVALGCGVEYLGSPGCPPVRLSPPATRVHAPSMDLATTQSSQFISALLLVSPWLGGVSLRLRGVVTSPSYITMTLGLLRDIGVAAESSDDLSEVRVKSAPPPTAFSLDIEPDASGATYWWGAGALLPGSCIRVLGAFGGSLQGDAAFPGVLDRMGARTRRDPDTRSVQVAGPDRLGPVSVDLSSMPDAAMTLAAVACFAEGNSLLSGLRTLRVKETDRIEALTRELAKIGVTARCPAGNADALEILPPPGGVATSGEVEFDTYDDHRMAMSLALIGLRRRGVVIRNPGCVAKTYPEFWRELARILTPA